ncbi:MAG: electron transfer flavoprotein subunit beta/FixA family protein [Bacteroidales bacterium]
MKILVCISEVPDTTTKVRFKDQDTALDTAGIQWIINPWDELALTRALEMKEASGGVVEAVSVATVGTVQAEPTIRKALAVGADTAIRVDAAPKDAWYVAVQLAEVVKNGDFSIVMAGRDSADYNGASVGGVLASLLDYNSLASVSSMTLGDGKVTAVREIDGGTETLEADMPLVAVVQKGIAIEPRIPAMRGIMMARTKPLNVVQPIDVEPLTEIVGFTLPKPRGACRKFASDEVKALVDVLHNEAKLI